MSRVNRRSAHAHAEVLALHDRSADALGIRLTHDWDHLHGRDFGGAVPRFAFAACAIDLDELGEASQRSCSVVVIAERYGAKPSVVIWNCAARSRVTNAFDENVRGGLVALAQRNVQHQFECRSMATKM